MNGSGDVPYPLKPGSNSQKISLKDYEAVSNVHFHCNWWWSVFRLILTLPAQPILWNVLMTLII